MAHRTQGNTFSGLLKEMIKDTGEEIQRARSRRALRAGALSRKLTKFCAIGIFMQVSSLGMIHY